MAYNREKYLRNREKRIESVKGWKKDNPDKVKGYNREWAKKHYHYNRERALKYGKKYRLTPKGRYADHKHSSKVRKLEFLTFDEFVKYWQKPCFYCGDAIQTIGLDRIDSKKRYYKDNVVPCCTKCNYMKSFADSEEFIERCRRIVGRHTL